MKPRQVRTGDVGVDKALANLREEVGDKAKRRIPYLYAANSLATVATDRYLFPGWESAAAGTTEYRLIALHDGVLCNLKARVATGGDTAGFVTIVVRVNGKDTSLSVRWEQKASGVFTSRNNQAVPVKENDLISVVVRKTAAPVTAPSNCMVQFELEY